MEIQPFLQQKAIYCQFKGHRRAWKSWNSYHLINKKNLRKIFPEEHSDQRGGRPGADQLYHDVLRLHPPQLRLWEESGEWWAARSQVKVTANAFN